MAKDLGMPRDTAALREFLLLKMIEVAEGKLPAEQVKPMVNLAQQVYNTLALEAKVARAKAQYGEAFQMAPVAFK